MTRYIYDLETNGLLNEVSKIHVLCMIDVDTKERFTYTSASGLSEGLHRLFSSDELIGHNIISYDNQVIEKLYRKLPSHIKMFDTMIAAGLIWSDRYEMDKQMVAKGKATIPGNVMGRNSLESWGYRLGEYKGDYTGGWEVLNDEMVEYCEQDVIVTSKLYDKILSKNYSQTAFDIEMQVATIITRQEMFGFGFDKEAAVKLLVKLHARESELYRELQEHFKPFYKRDGKTFIPKKTSNKSGYTEGCPITKVKITEFNPGSRDHIGARLQAVHGWKPTDFGADGKPTVDEDVLSGLKYPIAKVLVEYLMIEKRLGQLSEGNQAWLKVERNGRIHGRVDSVGTVTGRMTHSSPNLAQVPACGAPYGEECRALFIADKGWKLVGADASGLELRMLAHFLSKWDSGYYTGIVCEGTQEQGNDVHTVNQKAAGLETRSQAKTMIYALLYGAGAGKLGTIVGGGAKAGARLRSKFLAGLPALGKLFDAVQRASAKGYLIGLDGRHVKVRSEHAALNTLLQSAGAVVMKKALCILEDSLLANGLQPGIDYKNVLNCHDEYGITCKPHYAELVGTLAVESIRKAGEFFNMRCPLDGAYKIGDNWSETH